MMKVWQNGRWTEPDAKTLATLADPAPHDPAWTISLACPEPWRKDTTATAVEELADGMRRRAQKRATVLVLGELLAVAAKAVAAREHRRLLRLSHGIGFARFVGD